MDPSERTCKLCIKRDVCRIKKTIVSDLEMYKDTLGDDYDDVLVDVGAICKSFVLED